MEQKINYGFYALYIGCEYKSLDEKIPDGRIDGFSVVKDHDMQFVDLCFVEKDTGERISIPSNCFDNFKLKLRTFESLTEDEWQEIWVRIGGTPHLYEHGIEELKETLNGSTPEGMSLQLDYFTIAQLINYLRSIWVDCDNLIEEGFAIDNLSKPPTHGK